MHRDILGLKRFKENPITVDHINRNSLDNRKNNLRKATHKENLLNRPSPRGNCKYKGVSKLSGKLKWRAYICLNKKYIHLGYFSNDVDAAKAYDIQAKLLFGEFAYLNFLND